MKKFGINNIYKNELALSQLVYNKLKNMNNIDLYSEYPEISSHAPVISFNVKGRGCEEIAEILSDKYNIAVRSGLHCAPLAHKSKNTLESGTVRVVPSIFTSKKDIYSFVSSLYKIIT